MWTFEERINFKKCPNLSSKASKDKKNSTPKFRHAAAFSYQQSICQRSLTFFVAYGGATMELPLQRSSM